MKTSVSTISSVSAGALSNARDAARPPEQRAGLKDVLSGGKAQREIQFSQPGSLTKVFAVASGKGGVGKSSVTINLALAMAKQGLRIGVVDADIYGHSVPAMLGAATLEGAKLATADVGMDAATAQVFLVGIIVSGLVGYLTVRFFLRYLVGHTLDVFAAYRLALAAVTVAWLVS